LQQRAFSLLPVVASGWWWA